MVKNFKRKRGIGPMVDGDVESASVVTTDTIYETKKDGSVVEKEIWVPLYPKASTVENTPQTPPFTPSFTYEPIDNPSSPPQKTKNLNE